MPHPDVLANGGAMPEAVAYFEHPAGFGRVALACAALRRHRVALDALRLQATAEAAEFARARRDMEGLIGRLIDQLDAADGDPDLEDGLDTEPEIEDYDDADREEDDPAEDGGDMEPSLCGVSVEMNGGDRDLEGGPAEMGVADEDALDLVNGELEVEQIMRRTFDGSGKRKAYDLMAQRFRCTGLGFFGVTGTAGGLSGGRP